jgi:hypothetical protein
MKVWAYTKGIKAHTMCPLSFNGHDSSSKAYLDPAKTGFNLQLLHQLPGLADTHGAVHWGVSFHPVKRAKNKYGT